MKRVLVLGLGYVGLPTAIHAAQVGYEVHGFDIDEEKVKQINAGKSPIFEPELSERLWHVLKMGSFRASTKLQYADCFIIAVPTPLHENKTANLDYVFAATRNIAKHLMPGNLVLLESTVPVGTTEKVASLLEEVSGLKIGIDFFVAHCPERMLPGKIFKELFKNDRIIGGVCQRSSDLARIFYTKFTQGFLHITNDKIAEIVKLIENSSRDVQIAFANQVASMCYQVDLDPYHVIELANKHPRVKILTPTCGVGGHCIAVDPLFLIKGFPEETRLLQTARTINEVKPFQVINRVIVQVENLRLIGLEKPKILLLGLTFKPDVDDIRESPALLIADKLSKKKDLLELKACDHYASPNKIQKHGINLVSNMWEGLEWADIVLILVKHEKFLLISDEILTNKIVIDTCGLLHGIHLKQTRALLEGVMKTKLSVRAKEKSIPSK